MDSLNIDIIITLVSEYLGVECKNFLKYMNSHEKYNYLYTVFNRHNAKLQPVNVRYLINYNRASGLRKYINLISIEFDHKFNGRLLINMFPNSVQSISFGYKFNQPIKKGMLPKNLNYLSVSPMYKQTIEKNAFPKFLNKVIFREFLQHTNYPLHIAFAFN